MNARRSFGSIRQRNGSLIVRVSPGGYTSKGKQLRHEYTVRGPITPTVRLEAESLIADLNARILTGTFDHEEIKAERKRRYKRGPLASPSATGVKQLVVDSDGEFQMVEVSSDPQTLSSAPIGAELSARNRDMTLLSPEYWSPNTAHNYRGLLQHVESPRVLRRH